MENPPDPELLGPNGLIRKDEFVRIIVQSLYSVGYSNSASHLELESGVSNKSPEIKSLESHVCDGDWDGCVTVLNSIEDMLGETMGPALFLVFRQRFVEHLSLGEVVSALDVLRKQISVLDVDKRKVHRLAYTLVSLKDEELGAIVGCDVLDLRRKLLKDLGKLLPPPISLPDRRLEDLVESVVASWFDRCKYHNSLNHVSLYEDHHCGSDQNQIPTRTTQTLSEHKNEVRFVQFSNNGEFLASSSNDCTIIWKVDEDDHLSQATMIHNPDGDQHAVSYVAWSPDDTMLLTCGNQVLKLWDVETGTCKLTLGDQGFVINCCAWFPDSKYFVWFSSSPEESFHIINCVDNMNKASRTRFTSKIVDFAITPDFEHSISIFADKKIQIYHIRSTACRTISLQHPITSVSVSRDNKVFSVNLNNQEIHKWDVDRTWKGPMAFVGHKQHKSVIRSCFGGWNSRFIASGSEDSQVTLTLPKCIVQVR